MIILNDGNGPRKSFPVKIDPICFDSNVNSSYTHSISVDRTYLNLMEPDPNIFMPARMSSSCETWKMMTYTDR